MTVQRFLTIDLGPPAPGCNARPRHAGVGQVGRRPRTTSPQPVFYRAIRARRECPRLQGCHTAGPPLRNGARHGVAGVGLGCGVPARRAACRRRFSPPASTAGPCSVRVHRVPHHSRAPTRAGPFTSSPPPRLPFLPQPSPYPLAPPAPLFSPHPPPPPLGCACNCARVACGCVRSPRQPPRPARRPLPPWPLWPPPPLGGPPTPAACGGWW